MKINLGFQETLFVAILRALCLQSLSNIHGVMGYTLANADFSFLLLVQQKSSAGNFHFNIYSFKKKQHIIVWYTFLGFIPNPLMKQGTHKSSTQPL